MYDVIIIGCGPAGMTAAIYLKQAGINVAIIEKNAPGGSMNMAINIKNYPGFNQIKGAMLSLNMFNQIRELEIPYIYGDVIAINDGEIKQIITNKDTYETKYLVISTGRKNKELHIQNEKEYLGKGISYCAICDGSLYKNKEVVIVGSSIETAEEALYLADQSEGVTIINQEKDLNINDELRNSLKNKENIHYLNNSKIIRLIGNDSLEQIEIKNVVYNETFTKKIDGLFVSIGYEPNSKIFSDLGINCKNGYIVVDDNNRTNKRNIYAIGDITSKKLYQVVTATSDGAKAAYDIICKENK
mgnify:CR=1 FL=1